MARFSTHVPSLVYPDTWQARCDREHDDPKHECIIGFCPDFKIRQDPLPCERQMMKVTCRNRTYEGDRRQNWCLRCMVGYPYLTQEASESIWGKGAAATHNVTSILSR